MNRPVHVLVVDDSERDCLLILRQLMGAGFDPHWERVDDEAALREALRGSDWEIVIVDHSIPGFDGMQALSLVRELRPSLPTIVVSGTIGEEEAVEAIRQGAADYIMKDRMKRLPSAVTRELSQAADRTARLEAEQRIEHMARHDSVTDLPNRGRLEGRIQSLLGDPTQNGFAVLRLELTYLSTVARTFGYEVADDVMRSVAKRLRASLPDGAELASLHRGDFGILLGGGTAAKALSASRRLLEVLQEPVNIGGLPLQLDAVVGIALSPGHGANASHLLRSAEVATEAARKSGEGFAIYDGGRNPFDPEKIALLGELRGAISSDQLILEYQPMVELATGRPAAIEALVRWQHPRRGLIPPADFVPQAETSGLASALTSWVLATGMSQWKSLGALGRNLQLAINLPARALLHPRLLDEISDGMAASSMDPSRLSVEITEGTLMEEPERAKTILQELRSRGVRLAIDDFGTGYSSLAYLRDLPVHEVKIDRSFVSRICNEPRDAKVVNGIVELGHTLGLEVVAEGVEGETTASLLSAFGCDMAQGYYFARPMEASRLSLWLADRVPNSDSRRSS